MFLPKKLVKTAKWAVIGSFAIDAAVLAGGYYGYHQMTRSTEFRRKVYNYDERFVDLYYRANEKHGDGKARQTDYEAWGIKDIKSFEYVGKLGL